MSQGSHATGHGGGGGSRNAAPPVPYGDALLDHSPPVFCSCNLKCLKLISWSEGNPVRRYYRCQNVHMDHDCGYFRWIDPRCGCPSFLSTLLLDLRSEVRNLERETAAEREATIQMERMYEKKMVEVEEQILETEKQIQAMDAALEAAAATETDGRLIFGSILFVFAVGVWCGVNFSLRKTV